MKFFENLLKKGELPEVRTSIEVENNTLVRIGVTVVIVAAIVLLVNSTVKKLSNG